MMIRGISEDAVDLAIRELLESLGWKTAYYSPPHGSWSIIQFEINKILFRGFSPRDAKRPDLILYKKEQNKLFLILIESKEEVSKFSESRIKDYLKNMKKYIKKILNMSYRHRKTNFGWDDWNKKISMFSSLKKEIGFLFVAGSKNNFKENLIKLKSLAKKFKKYEENILFGLVTFEVKEFKNKIVFVYNKKNLFSKILDEEFEVDYSTLQK